MTKRFKIFLAIFPYLVFGITGVCSKNASLLPTSLPIPYGGAISRTVNIALLIDVSMVSIATDSSYEIRGELISKSGSETESDLFLHGEGPWQATIQSKKNGIEINHKLYPVDNLIVKVLRGSIQVEKRRYYHQIRISRNSDGTLTIINQIDIDEYLKGVLPLEAHHDWPIETLKAHAVVSRTFALFKSIEKQDQNFSLRDTVQSQVYGGALFHKRATDRAIEITEGEILTFQGNIFPAYFHASCGGHTVQADHIWRVEPNPVLNGTPCQFCGGSKHSKWSLGISLAEVEAIMQKKGFPAKNLKQISFDDRDSSGRVSKVTLEYQRSKLIIPAIDFRAFIGYNRLRSLKAHVEIKNENVHIHGFGWGHGVGFCQWGAKRQAEVGRTYREILEFYFPGSEIKKV